MAGGDEGGTDRREIQDAAMADDLTADCIDPMYKPDQLGVTSTQVSLRCRNALQRANGGFSFQELLTIASAGALCPSIGWAQGGASATDVGFSVGEAGFTDNGVANLDGASANIGSDLHPPTVCSEIWILLYKSN
ncbi:hypothetical protein ACP4OV_027106 [Aristida adscensionis]